MLFFFFVKVMIEFFGYNLLVERSEIGYEVRMDFCNVIFVVWGIGGCIILKIV